MKYSYKFGNEKEKFCNNKETLISSLKKRTDSENVEKINKWIDSIGGDWDGFSEYYIDKENDLFVAAIR